MRAWSDWDVIYNREFMFALNRLPLNSWFRNKKCLRTFPKPSNSDDSQPQCWPSCTSRLCIFYYLTQTSVHITDRKLHVNKKKTDIICFNPIRLTDQADAKIGNPGCFTAISILIYSGHCFFYHESLLKTHYVKFWFKFLPTTKTLLLISFMRKIRFYSGQSKKGFGWV